MGEKRQSAGKKTPMTDARNGKNIFDQELNVPTVADAALKHGTGGIRSSDGLRLYAEITGTPTLDRSNQSPGKPCLYGTR